MQPPLRPLLTDDPAMSTDYEISTVITTHSGSVITLFRSGQSSLADSQRQRLEKQKEKQKHVYFLSYRKLKTTLLDYRNVMYHQKKRQKHGKCNGEGKYSTLRVPASLGQLVIVSRKLMHSADIVYKNGRIIVVEITVDMKNVIIAIIYAPQTSVEKNQKKSSNMYKCY